MRNALVNQLCLSATPNRVRRKFGAAAMAVLACWVVALGAVAQDQAAAGVGGSWSADLPAVSDGRHLWLVLPTRNDDKQEATRLMHADLALDEPVWESVTQTLGRTSPRSIAADGRTLWLFYDGGAVEVLGLRPAPIEGDWFFSIRREPALPSGLTVRAAAARGDEAWVIVRAEDEPTLRQLDQLGQTVASEQAFDEALNIVLGLPRPLGSESQNDNGESPSDAPEPSEDGTTAISAPPQDASADDPPAEGDAEPETEADTESDPEEPTDQEAAPDLEPLETPGDRLLHLTRGGWQNLPLPEAWSHGDAVSILPAASTTADQGVTLLAAQRTGDRGSLHRYRWSDDNGWTSSELPLQGRGEWQGLVLHGQEIVLHESPADTGLTTRVSAVRGQQWIDIGQVSLPQHSGGRWSAIAVGDAVGLVAGPREFAKPFFADPLVPGDAALSLAAIDLHGQPVGPAITPVIDEPSPIADAADQIILLTVVISSTVLLFSFWRRDPTVNELELPDGVVVADLLRRLMSGLIDLAPGIGVSMAVFTLEAGEVYNRWPGRGVGATWNLMLPGMLAIATVVVHTAVLEAVTGRSLGKWLTGLRVTTLTGDRPKLWQVLVRCVLKSFDLVAYLLLVLPLVSPYRQRLGDMVARTVVVMKAPQPNTDGEDQS